MTLIVIYVIISEIAEKYKDRRRPADWELCKSRLPGNLEALHQKRGIVPLEVAI